MDHLRKWLKYQQYLPKQLQIPHSTSARACIYYPGHGTRPYEPADTEGWEQGWGASIAELAWGVEWCQPPISGPSCVSLAEGPQGAPVPLLHPFQPGCWKEIDCHLHFLLKSQFGHMNSYSFVWFFSPKTRQILVLRSGNAPGSHGEKKHDHPWYWTIFRHRSSEKDSFPVKAGEPLWTLMRFFKHSGNLVY